MFRRSDKDKSDVASAAAQFQLVERALVAPDLGSVEGEALLPLTMLYVDILNAATKNADEEQASMMFLVASSALRDIWTEVQRREPASAVSQKEWKSFGLKLVQQIRPGDARR